MSDKGIFDDSEEEEEQPVTKKRRLESSMIDDAAEESGEDSGEDEDENDDDGEDDYVKDGFVVDDQEKEEKVKKGDLEDSDDDDDDDSEDGSDDDDDSEDGKKKKRRFKKVRKVARLDDDDLALVQEASGIPREDLPLPEEEVERETIVAKTEAELRKGLFDDENDAPGQAASASKPTRVERYDEDGMDDFIEDDIGDQGAIMASEHHEVHEGTGVSEAQLQEASAIFGDDYLEFMQDDKDDEEANLMGDKSDGDSDDSVDGLSDDDDDDLFGDEDDADGLTAGQRAEALKLKREKRRLAKQERRRLAEAKKSERRRAQLRRAFEPVQLVEHFCTERDDEIRQADVPERMFGETTQFYGSTEEGMNAAERDQAEWIVGRVPAVASEYIDADETQKSVILESIAYALRYMHCDKLEPSFIKRYRKDYVASVSVQDHLYAIKDADNEWDRLQTARDKIEIVLEEITKASDGDAMVGADAEYLDRLRQELSSAQTELDSVAAEEAKIKQKLEVLDVEDDSDDELFGDDDDKAEDRKKERETLKSHLVTTQSLLEMKAEKVNQLQSQLESAEATNQALNDRGPMERISRKTCRDNLWNPQDYATQLQVVSDAKHVVDMNTYLNLIKEGNEAVRKKEVPILSGVEDKAARKRSRRFDRDFYRTCVSEGLRTICYRYLLAPNRVGIKLEEMITTGQFNFTRTMPGESGSHGDPQKWSAPMVSSPPAAFASDLIGSGELVLLSNTGGAGASDTKDPLRGCRYVAAMELAFEPRVRSHLRGVYRKHARLTSKPTSKGRQEVDYFHDSYGLHLIYEKPVTIHFPTDKDESEAAKLSMDSNQRVEYDKQLKKDREESCLQYLGMLKAERNGDLNSFIHLPLLERNPDWYKFDAEKLLARENQNVEPLLSQLEKVYFPVDGDSEEWNEERRKVLRLALNAFLLPHFEAELRRDLLKTATEVGVATAGQNLHDSAMIGPYRPACILHTENRFLSPTGDLPFVGVCCSLDGKDATYLAAVSESGESSDYLAVPSGTRFDQGKMREKVLTFLMHHRPAAVIVGTSGGFGSRLMTRKFVDLIKEAEGQWSSRYIQGEEEDDEAFETRQAQFRQMQLDRHYDDDDEDDWKCNVELVDDSIAQLFSRSVRGRKEFPDYAVNLKSAIAVARYAQNPLAELTYTWSVASDAGNFGTEMLYMNIHPLQQLLPKTQLLREYERVLCEVTAEIGVDIQTASTHDHLRGLLMFVPGLGPRKAANLKQSLGQLDSGLQRRRDLLEKRLLGPVVYNNAVAFLRVRENDSEEAYFHPLDDTRLHPDVYQRHNWAVKIAFDALERESTRGDESAEMKALRDVMADSQSQVDDLFNATRTEWDRQFGVTGGAFNIKDWNPLVNVPKDRWRDKVEELDLDAFANMIHQGREGRWHSHLDMIKWEFRLPFCDPRKPLEPLHTEALFGLITGETDQSLRPGKEITGKVIQNSEFGSRVKLEGDIPAFIPTRLLSDDHVETPEDVVSAGQIVTAVVTTVKKEHMTVDLSLRMEDFKKEPSSWERPAALPALDLYFDAEAMKSIEQDNSAKRSAHLESLQLSLSNKNDGEAQRKKPGRVVRRACTHPAFRNAKSDEVTKELADGGVMMIGEALIRPSSKNSDSLAIHWLVKEGSIKVIEVIEENKETDASIGNILKVKDETYGSIDELLGRYIAPMNDHVEELINHRKFSDILEDELDEQLVSTKKVNPKSIPYALCWMEGHPGYASLRFVLNTTPRSHPVGIGPKGFAWGASSFSSLDGLINAFKKKPSGPTKPKPVAPPPKPPAPVTRAPSLPAPPANWGSAPPAPPLPPAMATGGWSQAPPTGPPPVPPIQAGGWSNMPPNSGWSDAPQGGSSGWSSAPQGGNNGWGQPAPPPRQPPLPPPPPANAFPPQGQPPRPPVQNLPPPPFNHRPPPPAPPNPPAFGGGAPAASQGRGRGRTLPAWMVKDNPGN